MNFINEHFLDWISGHCSFLTACCRHCDVTWQW